MTNLGKTLTTIVLIAAFTGTAFANVDEGTTQESKWNFEVLLNNKPIGFHSFDVSDDGGNKVLKTRASFDVKVLFINAFRYRHDNTEVWSNGCLKSIDANTNSNGDVLSVRGERGADETTVFTTAGEQTLGSCVQTFAYWNPDILQSRQLLNSQTGELEDVSVEKDGLDTVEVNGTPVDAVKYSLKAKAGVITLWYSNDESQRWLGLEAPAKGGRKLRYIPVDVPAGHNAAA